MDTVERPAVRKVTKIITRVPLNSSGSITRLVVKEVDITEMNKEKEKKHQEWVKSIYEKEKEYNSFANLQEHVNKLNKELDELSDRMDWELLNTEIKFGKYKGTKYKFVDDKYLHWIVRENIIKDNKITDELKNLLQYLDIQSQISYNRTKM